MTSPEAEPRKANRGPSAGPENRRALIAAAREVFGDGGYNAPLSSVAKLAGVGQGSLYRHFPDRLSLAIAVFDENIGDLEAVVERDESTLDDLLDVIIAQALVSTAMIDMITADLDDPRVQHLDTRIEGVVEVVVQRERAAGRIGSNVETDDVLLAISMLAGVVARTPADRRDAVARRAWSLFHVAFVRD
ncbi:TetR/AcrR family transcriptional regulator [Clavibacter michiganensis]|nr:TetR family transcriptional regulator [Clavibacter michiganensis]PPF61884.1 TetR/AcrR family transcriptional regulator [Clavibacter michiganensis]